MGDFLDTGWFYFCLVLWKGRLYRGETVESVMSILCPSMTMVEVSLKVEGSLNSFLRSSFILGGLLQEQLS